MLENGLTFKVIQFTIPERTQCFADIDCIFFLLILMCIFLFLTVLCILYFNYGLLSEINMDGWMDYTRLSKAVWQPPGSHGWKLHHSGMRCYSN